MVLVGSRERSEEKTKQVNIPKSYDLIGDILLIEIPETLRRDKKIIAEKLLEQHRNVKTVFEKIGGHKGKHRIQGVKCIGGEKRTETIYRENGVSIKLDVSKVFFSPRLSNERKRIASIVKPKESVLVMFSGCGPYPLVIARNSKAKEIFGIEINPDAHKYAVENVKLNKFKNIFLYKGNVKKVIPQLKKKFDRIIMPLPKTGETFLQPALNASKKGAIIHFYDFSKEEEIPQSSIKKIRRALRNRKFKLIRFVKCGQPAPRMHRVCIDFKIL
ncbi:MAG TPA: class I SAM-dependent methyltransferase family protein [Candidatus Nanoarchaeia archaeon]|nr:class I SAM-dependent methyltransferase family protein [Candidatus Nanoarchaeia archaeon]